MPTASEISYQRLSHSLLFLSPLKITIMNYCNISVKSIISSCAVVFMLPATAGLFDASPSDKVKSAVINSDTGLTYKQFFSGYKYAKSVNWSETKIEGGV